MKVGVLTNHLLNISLCMLTSVLCCWSVPCCWSVLKDGHRCWSVVVLLRDGHQWIFFRLNCVQVPVATGQPTSTFVRCAIGECQRCPPAHLPACLSAYMSVCLSVCLQVCLPACLPTCLSVCLSVCRSACLPVCLHVCLSSPLSLSQEWSLCNSVVYRSSSFLIHSCQWFSLSVTRQFCKIILFRSFHSYKDHRYFPLVTALLSFFCRPDLYITYCSVSTPPTPLLLLVSLISYNCTLLLHPSSPACLSGLLQLYSPSLFSFALI